MLSKGDVRRDGLPLTIESKLNDVSIQTPGAYARCLLDPEHSGPVTIPDEASYPTTTFTTTSEIDIPVVLSAGDAASYAGIKVILACAGNYALENTTTVEGAYAYATVVSYPWATDFQARYIGARLVAASLRVEYQGTDASNQGMIVGSVYSRSTQASALGIEGTLTATSLTNQRNCRDTYVGPAKHGVILTYRPVDSISFAMQESNVLSNNYGVFQAHINKCAVTASASFVGYLVMHWEGITKNPTNSTILTTNDVTPLCNPFEMQLVNTILPAFPLVAPGTEASSGATTATAVAIEKYIRETVGAYTTTDLIKGAFRGWKSIHKSSGKKRKKY